MLGVLHVGWRQRHLADDRQQRFLEIIAGRAAASIAARALTEELDEARLQAEALAAENARLYEAEQVARQRETQRAARLVVLKEIADSASSSLDVRQVAWRIVDSVHRLLAAEHVQVRLANEDRTLLESCSEH